MSTLLDIKSSVLRQVQVCPSFRRKTEQEPEITNSQEPPTGAWWVPRTDPAGHVYLASLPSWPVHSLSTADPMWVGKGTKRV